jgi:hypothetical protein
VTEYYVWRVTCPASFTSTSSPCSVTPENVPVRIGTYVPGAPFCHDSFLFCDGTAMKGVVYLYFITDIMSGTKSTPSNIVAERR